MTLISRRQFIGLSGGLVSQLAFGDVSGARQHRANRWHMPEEGVVHARTWMAFVASRDVWADRQIVAAQHNLATIARTIARYEPVTMLVRKQDHALALRLLGQAQAGYPIELIETSLNDLWIRDTGPSFVFSDAGKKAAVDFNFNGWGTKQAYEHDAKIATFVAQRAGVLPVRSSLVLEGGCFEVDGEGTAIMTESCILNDNRNPHISKHQAEKELKRLLGLQKIIWLKGIQGRDITDGHTDFYARFARPGVVVVSRENDQSLYDYAVTRENIKQLQAATDSKNRPLEIVILDTPRQINEGYGTEQFAAGYVGYYICNGAVIMQKFGDSKADEQARTKVAQLFPDRVIEQLAIDAIASGGGSIHCATQQEPLV